MIQSETPSPSKSAGAELATWIPLCVTVKVCPPIRMVPERGLVPGWAATLNETVPLPSPLAPDVTVIHGWPEDALQAQPAGAVTVTVPEPPAASKLWLTGSIAKLQEAITYVSVTTASWFPAASAEK